MGTDAHRAAAAEQGPITVGVVTVSDTRTADDDPNGAWLRERIAAAGAVAAGYRVVRDEPDEVRAAVDELVAEARVVVVNGGTGISRRDTTYDTLAAMLEKQLPGFGELFRMLSWEQVGAAAMLSRATAGTYRGERRRLGARLAEGGAARVGEADRARARAPRLGGRALAARPGCAEVDVLRLDRLGGPTRRRLIRPVEVRVRDDQVGRRRPHSVRSSVVCASPTSVAS